MSNFKRENSEYPYEYKQCGAPIGNEVFYTVIENDFVRLMEIMENTIKTNLRYINKLNAEGAISTYMMKRDLVMQKIGLCKAAWTAINHISYSQDPACLRSLENLNYIEYSYEVDVVDGEMCKSLSEVKGMIDSFVCGNSSEILNPWDCESINKNFDKLKNSFISLVEYYILEIFKAIQKEFREVGGFNLETSIAIDNRSNMSSAYIPIITKDDINLYLAYLSYDGYIRIALIATPAEVNYLPNPEGLKFEIYE